MPQVPQDLSTLSYDDLVVLGQQFSSASKWLLRDLASMVDTRHRNHSLAEFAEQIGVHSATLMQYRTVAGAYPAGSPRRDVAFGVYQALTAQHYRLELLAGATALP